MGDVRASLFGTLAVRAGLATKTQVDECIAEQQAARERGDPIPKLGELMAEKGYLSLDQVGAILRGDFAVPGRRFGELCLQMQFCNMEQVQQALDEQERLRLEGGTQRIGNILVKQGHIKPQQVSVVLQAQGFEIAECSKCRLTYNVDMNSPASSLKCERCERELIMVTGYDEIDLSDVIQDIKPKAASHPFTQLGPDVVAVSDDMEIEAEEIPLDAFMDDLPVSVGAAHGAFAEDPDDFLGVGDAEEVEEAEDVEEAEEVEEADEILVDDAFEVEEVGSLDDLEEISPEEAAAAIASTAYASGTVPALGADSLEPGEPLDNAEGSLTYGEFRTLRKIGEDALGILYKATNTKTGEDVALKVIDLERARGRKFAERFVREARLAASLEHESLKRVTAAGRERGQLYYASEYISGKSVRQLIESEGRVSIKAANRIIKSVAEGLRHAHKQGVFHGNIRPSSILVTPDGVVKLSDTGVAKNIRENIERLVRVHGLMSFYLAPELATPEGVMDVRSDMFELGATYYHMITGKPPFEGTSPLQVFMLMAEREAIPVHLVNASVPIQVSEVIKRMMAPEPDDRYQSMDELIEALNRTGNLQTISELPVDLQFPAAEAVPEGVRPRPKSKVRPKATTVRKTKSTANTQRASGRDTRTRSGRRSADKGGSPD